jgi:spore maturation protein CgeB
VTDAGDDENFSHDRDVSRFVIVDSKPLSRPRICMPTSRDFIRQAFRCGLYEAQDVLAEIDDVDLICLEPEWGFRFRESWLKRLVYRDVTKRLAFLNPGLQTVRLTQEYDLFVAVCPFLWDLLHINAIERWEDHCRISVCWIDELWAAAIPAFRHWLHALDRFDYVFVGYAGSVAALSNAINRPCRWLPGAVDTLRFSPYPNPPERAIDVYSIGRRREDIHRVLLQAAGQRGLFYIHDTFQGADTEVYNHRQHRDLFANLAKRSRYFMVAPAKIDQPETQGQVEIANRYYEGAAAGAVMIGQQPTCDSFGEMFSWPDAVIHVRPDGSDVLEVLAGLGSEPARVSAISRRNAAETLLRHDWVYRWKEIFRATGVEPSPRLAGRERRLKELADLANGATGQEAHD